jgi:hypothetical protein
MIFVVPTSTAPTAPENCAIVTTQHEKAFLFGPAAHLNSQLSRLDPALLTFVLLILAGAVR